MTNATVAEGLVKRFGDTAAPAGVDLAVRTGSVLGLLGPNGAGKTTAVRVPATLIKPDAGHAEVGGYDVVKEGHQVRRLIGLLSGGAVAGPVVQSLLWAAGILVVFTPLSVWAFKRRV